MLSAYRRLLMMWSSIVMPGRSPNLPYDAFDVHGVRTSPVKHAALSHCQGMPGLPAWRSVSFFFLSNMEGQKGICHRLRIRGWTNTQYGGYNIHRNNRCQVVSSFIAIARHSHTLTSPGYYCLHTYTFNIMILLCPFIHSSTSPTVCATISLCGSCIPNCCIQVSCWLFCRIS